MACKILTGAAGRTALAAAPTASVLAAARPGRGVRARQSELNANGCHLAVDGICGPLTLAAGHGFQAG